MIEIALALMEALLKANSVVIVGTAILAVLVYIAWRLIPKLLKPKLEDAVDYAKVELVTEMHTHYHVQLDVLTKRITEQADAYAAREVEANKRGKTRDDRIMRLETGMDLMSGTIHKQQVRITRFIAVFIQLEAHLTSPPVPQRLLDELSELIKDE